MLDPRGRVILITGTEGAMAGAVLERLLARGYSVSIGAGGPGVAVLPGDAISHPYDPTAAGSAAALVAATLACFGRIDGIVSGSSINPKARLLDADETTLDALWATNLKGPMRLVRSAWPYLVASGSGRVVSLVSLSAKRVRNDNAGYAMSKAGILALTQAIRRQGWEHGIRASAVCPSFIDTDLGAPVTSLPRAQMTSAADLAIMVEMLLGLPNTASIAELLVNCRHEDML